MRVVADLEAVGHRVARHQAVARGRRALGERIGYRRRADHQALASPLVHQGGEQVGELAYPVVAAMGVGPGGGDRDHCAHIAGAVWVEAGGAQLDPRALPEDAAVLRHGRFPESSSRLTTTETFAFRMASSPRS